MAAVLNSYSPYMPFQQSYQYPIFPGYPSQPFYSNYYAQQHAPVQSRQMPVQPQPLPIQMQPQRQPLQMQPQRQPMQMQPQPQQWPQPQPQPQVQQQQAPAIEYIDSGEKPLRPRREPRIYRQVIVLPTPEPIYRQVRHRLPTPERQVIQRTVIQKANGDVVVQQQRPTTKTRSQSRAEHKTQTRSSRSRQVHTD